MNRYKLTGLALVIIALTSTQAHAVVTITNPLNITLRNFQVETGGDTSDNPNVVNGVVGPLLPYTASNTTGDLGGAYTLANLNDGDIGIGVPSDGTYAIPNNNGTLNLALGAMQLVDSVAIYNGYGNRDDGTYTLRDGAGNLLGVWTITGTGGATNAGVDSFWLGLSNPVMTDALQLQISTTDSTPSFREIQIFQAIVPEPTTIAIWLIGGLSLVVFAALRSRRSLGASARG